jgi:hypothetical protein
VKAVTEEQKKAIFSVLSGRDTFNCLPSNYGKALNYQVAPAKTGLISRGENHSLSWQFLHMRDRKRVGSRQRSLLLRVPSTNRDLCQQGMFCLTLLINLLLLAF